MTFILSARHWQLFPFLLLGQLLFNTTIEFSDTYTVGIRCIGFVLFFGWPLLVGHALYDYLPGKISMNYHLFMINGFLFLLAFIAMMIVSDGEGMTFHGFSALPFFYIVYAGFNVLFFPARLIKSVEDNRKAGIRECIGTVFLILFLPIGIWFLQPRLNKIVNESASEQPLL